MTVDEVLEKVNHKIILLTGGEPLLQWEEAMMLLKSWKLEYTHGSVQNEMVIETNGSVNLKYTPGGAMTPKVIMDVKTPSSGEVGKTDWDNFQYLTYFDEVKFVVASEEDLTYALQVIDMSIKDCKASIWVISPVWPIDSENAKRIVEAIKKSEHNLRIQVQLHKQLNIA